MKFRKKPVVIEAVQFLPEEPSQVEKFPPWYVTALTDRVMRLDHGLVGGRMVPQLVVATSEGEMRANPCDWIIQGVKGELYPCKPDIFAATYEAVT